MRVRLRYSLRGLGVLTAIIAAGLGWYVARVRPQEQAVMAIWRAGGRVFYETSNGRLMRMNHGWRLRFGSASYVTLKGDGSVHGDVICRQLAKLSGLRHVHLESLQATNAGLADLGRLEDLEALALVDTTVDDNGLRLLSGLSSLKYFDLTGTSVSNAGIKEIAKLRSLEVLCIRRTKVTNSGVLKLQTALPGCKLP